MDIQQPERMRYLWKNGRAQYASFFMCLEQVRQEIGNEALENWCRDNLLISLTFIEKAAKLLPPLDAQRTKQELSEAMRLAREEKAEQRALKRLEMAKRQTALARQIASEEKTRKKIEERIRKPRKPVAPQERGLKRNKKGFRVVPHPLKAKRGLAAR